MPDVIYKKSSDIVFRQIGGEYILVPIRHKVGDLENIYTLNEVAARIWELIDGKNDIERIRDYIAREFEIDSNTAEKDIAEFIEQLKIFDGITV